MSNSEILAPQIDRFRGRFLLLGVAGLALTSAALLIDTHLFFRSYLLAFLFWLSIPLGCLSLLMLHHMVGGSWGFVIRRILEAATRTIPFMFLLYLPLTFGVSELYEWARPEVLATDEILQHKESYLNVPFFLTRSSIYFIFWIVWSVMLNRLSVKQDEAHDPGMTRRLQLISGPGLVMMGATVTFSSIDWAMSLEPHWFSTLYGLLFLEGQALTAMAFAVAALRLLRRYEPLSKVVQPHHFHDLGNLLLAFVMLWAYLNFSQYLIVWSANIPEEVPWYLNRIHGGWEYLALGLILFHFAVPFMLLLSRRTKKRGQMLGVLAVALLVVRLSDLYFLIIPGVEHHSGLHVAWSDLTAVVGMGGVWLWLFAGLLKERALLPVNDPRMVDASGGEEAMGHG